MIKTFSKVALVGLTVALMSGCGADKPEPKKKEVEVGGCKIENTKAPMWACIPEYSGHLAGVGIAPKSAAGIAHMRKVALMNGRSELAQQIESNVKDKMEGFTRATGTTGAESVDQVTTSVTKQVAKFALKGSKAVDYWEAPSGAIYMLVVVPESSVNATAKEALKQSLSSFKDDDKLWQQFQSKQALEALDKEFPTN